MTELSTEPASPKRLLILGTRGVPAAYGGFETFAEKLALYLVARGWQVTVYCQKNGGNKLFGSPEVDEWNGVRRVSIATSCNGPLSTIVFDWLSVNHALHEPGLPLILGYNTALFAARLRLKGRDVLMNMDGIEWKRAKWGALATLWFYLNEWVGALCSTKLVADHPRIADHLASRRRREDIATIAYGADPVTSAPDAPVRALGVEPGRYFLAIGRIEPENSTLEMVHAFTSAPHASRFICLGKLDPANNPYHAAVLAAGGDKVIFPGDTYDPSVVKALRFHAIAYCHGHTVGGTNPSLVEALGAGNAIIARDNIFNRWVAGDDQLYFTDVASCAQAMTCAEENSDRLMAARSATKRRFRQGFEWKTILHQYEDLFLQTLAVPSKRSSTIFAEEQRNS